MFAHVYLHTYVRTQEASVVATRRGKRNNQDKISLAVLLNINTAANMWLSKAGEAEDEEVMGTPFSAASGRSKG